jgi:hypothetical protein
MDHAAHLLQVLQCSRHHRRFRSVQCLRQQCGRVCHGPAGCTQQAQHLAPQRAQRQCRALKPAVARQAQDCLAAVGQRQIML